MTPNAAERHRTGEEFAENLALTGLTPQDAGGTPVPHTVLTDRSRLGARLWFRPRDAPPRHDFAAS